MVATYRGKRVFDIVVSLSAIVILSPLIAAISVLVYLFHGRPVFFAQERPGLRGKPFTMLKFRSMTDEKDDARELLPAEMRVTRFGKLIRLMSLDELPELFNVLRGQMSIVGPRPLLMDYLNYYSEDQMRRHDAKPGITGWAQINGRNNLTWEEKFAMDIWYVEHASLTVDLRVLAKTGLRVICARDINKDGFGHEGGEYFRGTSKSNAAERLGGYDVAMGRGLDPEC
jgi:sugar transferase EpsL